VVTVRGLGGHSGSKNSTWTGADTIGLPLVLFKTCIITAPESGIVHIVEMLELLVIPDVLPPLRRTVDEPRPARNASTTKMTMITATASFLMPLRVASWAVKFYSLERTSASYRRSVTAWDLHLPVGTSTVVLVGVDVFRCKS